MRTWPSTTAGILWSFTTFRFSNPPWLSKTSARIIPFDIWQSSTTEFCCPKSTRSREGSQVAGEHLVWVSLRFPCSLITVGETIAPGLHRIVIDDGLQIELALAWNPDALELEFRRLERNRRVQSHF